MKTEDLKSLKRMITFDFFNLYDKEKFMNWLSERENQISLDLYQFGNLNKPINRTKLYNAILLKFEQDFDEKSIENIENLKSVLKKYCSNNLDDTFLELELTKAVSFFYGNCETGVFDEFENDMSKVFWDLYEFTEMNKEELKNWKTEIQRECRNLIQEVDKM